MLGPEEVADFQDNLSTRLGKEVLSISAVTGAGLEKLLGASSVLVNEALAAAAREEEQECP